jgi:hypothetical protein
MSDTPMRMRKLRASILMVGWRSTKSLIIREDSSITMTAMTTAAIMIDTCSTMPTAVITESSENTISSSRICTMTLVNDGRLASPALSAPAFQLVVNFMGALGDEEQAADQQDHVAAGNPLTGHGDERRRQAHHPRDGQQQPEPRDHGQRQADDPRPLALLGPEPPGQDRDEHDVVDAEDDLEHRQREKGDPALEAAHPLEHRRYSGGW